MLGGVQLAIELPHFAAMCDLVHHPDGKRWHQDWSEFAETADSRKNRKRDFVAPLCKRRKANRREVKLAWLSERRVSNRIATKCISQRLVREASLTKLSVFK